MAYASSGGKTEGDPKGAVTEEINEALQIAARAWRQATAAQRAVADSFEKTAESHERTAKSYERVAEGSVRRDEYLRYADCHRDSAQSDRLFAEHLRKMVDKAAIPRAPNASAVT